MDVDVEPQPQPQLQTQLQPLPQLQLQPQPQLQPQHQLQPQPRPQPQPQLQPQPQSQPQSQAQTAELSPPHHGTVSDTGLPVQSVQESFDSRGNRIVIIEELDTPATRREKTKRAKAERARLAAEAAIHAVNAGEASGSGEQERGQATVPTPADPTLHLGQDGSDLSSLSGNSDEASGDEEVQPSTSTRRGRGRGRGRGNTQGKASQPKSPGLGSISLPPGERLESGTLGIPPCHLGFQGSSDGDPQFGRNISHTLGGALSCMMMTCRKFRRTFYNRLITRMTTL